MDASIDGSSDGTAGQVIGVNATPDAIAPNSTTWLASYTSCTAAAWTSSPTALVYYFDRKR